MNKVLRPLFWLLLVFAIGLVVIYLDQTNQIPFLQSSPSVTPTDSKPGKTNPGSDPYKNFGN